MSHILDWMDSFYQPALTNWAVTCYVCGTIIPLHWREPVALAGWGPDRVLGLFHRCRTCGAECSQPLAGLALASPAGRRFYQEHRRIRLLPEQDIEADGHPAVVTRFSSLTTCDTLDVVLARDSGRLVRVHPAP